MKKVDKVGGVECDLCEAIVKVVEMYALQNSTEVCLLFIINLYFMCLFICFITGRGQRST